ncbi:hypothetical protein NKDENANG_02520 [Candidatus Entotheonellaceae bacterium PAL068K]
MALADLPPQPPMSPAAEQYAMFCRTQTARVQAETRHMLDISYGDDYWQKIDLYLPDAATVNGMPTLLFLHGGYWTHGYKEWLGFMAPVFVSLPSLFISVSYRLSPAAKHPAALEDCLTALAWGLSSRGRVWRGSAASLRGWPFRRRASGGAPGPATDVVDQPGVTR